jgi:hypothetical protein
MRMCFRICGAGKGAVILVGTAGSAGVEYAGGGGGGGGDWEAICE